MPKYLYFFSLFFFFSCGNASDESLQDVDIEETFDELSDQLTDPIWQVRSDGELFEIDIPTEMQEKDNLNPDARLQYAFIDKIDGVVNENYVIVIAELFPEGEDIASKVDILGFTEAYLDSLMDGKEGYTVENKPAIESINGLEAVVHELKAPIKTANDSLVDIYYMLGVYAGQKALYQVLSWTLYDQKELFRTDMKRMIYSFKEVGVETKDVHETHEDHDHSDYNH